MKFDERLRTIIAVLDYYAKNDIYKMMCKDWKEPYYFDEWCVLVDMLCGMSNDDFDKAVRKVCIAGKSEGLTGEEEETLATKLKECHE